MDSVEALLYGATGLGAGVATVEEGPSPFEQLGGQSAVRALVDRFYDLMSSLPEARPILGMHPADLSSSRDKLFAFMCGWLGGPPLYVTQYGHPRLRARHLPFSIGDAERDQWMLCMGQALEELVDDEGLRAHLHRALERLAGHMRNR